MTDGAPETGLVVSYRFLWAREHDRGAEHGRKARPACVVVPLTGRARTGPAIADGKNGRVGCAPPPVHGDAVRFRRDPRRVQAQPVQGRPAPHGQQQVAAP